MRVFTILLFTMGYLNVHAQISDTIVVESKILGETRKILVSLPDNYSADEKYPVSYILDGESLFADCSNVINYLANKGVIPQMISIGIININRSLDLTHTVDSTSNFKPNGGGKKFESFLINELIPNIEKNYNTAPYRLLIGHSISGLFSINLLLNNSSSFNSYLVIDPALWWNNMSLLSEAKQKLQTSQFADKKFYLGIANSLPADITDTSIALTDKTNATVGFRSIIKFKELLQEASDTKLQWASTYFEDESHGTVPFISTYQGLKYIFSYFKRPSFQTLTDSSSVILDNHYKNVSANLKYTVKPSANDLSGLAWRCQELDKNHDRAYSFLKLYIKYYPNDPIAYIQMGQHFEYVGNSDKAQEYYQKGIELGYDSNENNN